MTLNQFPPQVYGGLTPVEWFENKPLEKKLRANLPYEITRLYRRFFPRR